MALGDLVYLSIFHNRSDSERVETPERVDPPMAAVTPNTSNSPPKAAGNPRMSRALNRKKDSSAVDEQEAAIVPPPKRRRSRIPMLSTGSKVLHMLFKILKCEVFEIFTLNLSHVEFGVASKCFIALELVF